MYYAAPLICVVVLCYEHLFVNKDFYTNMNESLDWADRQRDAILWVFVILFMKTAVPNRIVYTVF